MPNIDLITLSGKVGYSLGGQIGQRGFQELELATITRLFPKKFSNVPTLRTRQHILLYWRKGFLKTTILKKFAETLPSKLKVLQLSAFTTETLLGSAYIPKNPFEKPRIIAPIAAGYDNLIFLEFTSMLMHGGSPSAKLPFLNDMTEGDPIVNALIKLGQLKIDETQIVELNAKKIKYDPDKGTLSYEPDFLVFGASHPFDKRTLALLIDSGLLDRFHIVQIRITTDIAKDCIQGEQAIDINLLQELKRQNEELSRTEIISIETPPPNLMQPLYERLFQLTAIPDYRIKGDFLRAASAHMVIRHFSEGNPKEAYNADDYTREDIDFVAKKLEDFVEPRLNPLVADGYPENETERGRNYAKIHIIRFLQESKLTGNFGEQLKDIVLNAQGHMSAHYQTVRNAVQELISQGRVEKVPEKFGYFRLADSERKE